MPRTVRRGYLMSRLALSRWVAYGKHRRLRAALAPANGLAIPSGDLTLLARTRGWDEYAGQPGMEVEFRTAQELVAQLMVGDHTTRDGTRELLALRVEVMANWRGRGVGGHLMDLIADAGARDWDVVSGHCDSDGRVCWLGYFDWDLREQHLHDNVAAIDATLSGTKKALVGASPADIVQIRRFLSQLNSSAKVTDQGWAVRPDLRGLQYEHDTVDSQEAATRLLLTLSTEQLVTLAKQSGSAAVALLAEGHDWYGIRPLHR